MHDPRTLHLPSLDLLYCLFPWLYSSHLYSYYHVPSLYVFHLYSYYCIMSHTFTMFQLYKHTVLPCPFVLHILYHLLLQPFSYPSFCASNFRPKFTILVRNVHPSSVHFLTAIFYYIKFSPILGLTHVLLTYVLLLHKFPNLSLSPVP